MEQDKQRPARESQPVRTVALQSVHNHIISFRLDNTVDGRLSLGVSLRRGGQLHGCQVKIAYGDPSSYTHCPLEEELHRWKQTRRDWVSETDENRKSVRYELDLDVAKTNINASCEGSVTDICTSSVWSKIRCLKGCHVSQTLVAIVPSRLAVWAKYAALEGKRPDRARMSRFRRDKIPAGGAAILHPRIAEAENRRGWSLTAPRYACSQQHPRRAV